MRIPPAVRFAAAFLLFAGWIGYLIWLASTSSKPTVLSRPQLLNSGLDVIAEVDSLSGEVKIKEVLFDKYGQVKEGDFLKIPHLADCKRLPREGEDPNNVPLDWTGPGTYLLPLKSDFAKKIHLDRTVEFLNDYHVAETPHSPGFPPRGAGDKGTPRIYPATEEVLLQYRKFRGTR